MKIEVTQENLARALQNCGRIATSRASLPILANILLRAEEGQLSVVATNLEIAVTHQVHGRIDTPGSVTVPARLLTDFVLSLPKGINIKLELENNKLKINTDRFSSTINGADAEEYPSLPSISKKFSFTIDGSVLKQAVSQTVIAASSDDTRPVLTGVYMLGSSNTLTLAATDSYRLAEKKVEIDGLKSELKIIVPARSLQELQRIIDTTEEVSVVADEGQIQFRCGDVVFISRLVEGTFPAYEQLIPGKSETNCILDKAQFTDITKVAGLFARDASGGVTISVSEEDNTIKISSVASQLGENTSTAEASVSGEGEVMLNSRYLIEALGVFDSSDIQFRFSGKISPCILETPKKEADYRHIIMPLKN